MPAAALVKAVDVLEQCLGELVLGRLSMTPDQFCLECFEKGFDGGIVIAISFATHRDCEAQLLQPLLVIVRAILQPCA